MSRTNTKVVPLYLSEEQYNQLHTSADQAGLTINAYVRAKLGLTKLKSTHSEPNQQTTLPNPNASLIERM